MRISVVALALALAITPVAAASTPSGPAPRPLGLRQAVQIAWEGRAEYQGAVLALQQAQLGLKQTRAGNLLRPNAETLLRAELSVERAEAQVGVVRRQVRSEAEKAFLTVLFAERQIELAAEGLSEAQDYQRIVALKRDEGLAAEVDVLAAEAALLATREEASAARFGAETARLDLAAALGVDAVAQALVTPESPAVSALPGEEEAVASALAADPELARTRDEVRLLALARQAAAIEGAAPLQVQSAQIAEEQGALDVKAATERVRREARRLRLQVTKALEARELVDKTAAIEEAKYRAVTANFEAGLAIPNDVLKAQAAVSRARFRALQALIEIYQAVAALNTCLGR